ncbi:MAG: DUF1587 domain-containing protein [Planctomycetota bacterium]
MAPFGLTRRCFAAVLLAALALPPRPGQAAETADPAPAELRAFLQANCSDCHADGANEGGFELALLPDDPSFHDAGRWDRVFDRIEAGEMPPPDYAELGRTEKRKALSGLSSWLRSKQYREIAEYGRSRGRRLTAKQLERSLHAVLGIDMPLTHFLPPDQRHHGFTTVTEGGISHHDLASTTSRWDAKSWWLMPPSVTVVKP